MGQGLGIQQGLAAFGGIFNDVDNVADIHHISGHLGLVGTEVGIPAAAGEPQAVQVVNVGAIATAIVEVGGVRGEKTSFHGETHEFESGDPGDLCPVSINGRLD